MVVVHLYGGLGNQLFQYATGRSVAVHHRTALRLDAMDYTLHPSRAYCLGHFNIQAKLAWRGPFVGPLAGFRSRHLLRWQRMLPYFWLRSIKDRPRHRFNPVIFEAGRNVRLKGYWQNERYFASIADLLRQELTVRTPPDRENAALAAAIREVESVSLHVRRTDYVGDDAGRRKHGSCAIEYYRTAVRELAARVREPHFFVFSDDPAWTRANLGFLHPATFVTHNGIDRSQEDLRLMTLCRHHIIANSTFSWWGAWLGTKPGRVVIAPKRWFAADTYDTRELIPCTWQRI